MDESTNIACNTILETLSLNPTSPKFSGNSENVLLPCLFCDHAETKELNSENKAILQHLYMQHRLVIADVQDVHDLSEYLNFWKNEFKGLFNA